ncbi:MAG: hypothetical protein KF729_21575 [Sandaracinaceae bacterium]|nr:hypothetical protein [Sandaracinaceae bacterium]
MRALALLFAIGALGAGSARADTLALVAPDDALRAAVATALAPWGVEVASVEALAPELSALERGARVAEATGAVMVAWLAPEPGGGSTLWIYDARARVADGRPLDATPPLAPATAAAVALALKARLRASALDPDAPPRAPPAPPSAPRVTPPAPEPARDGWTVELAAGARALATAPDRAEARLALAAAVWPAALGQHLGVGLRVTTGPGVETRDGEVELRWIETALDASIEARWVPLAPLELRARGGVGLRLTHLGGAAAGAPVDRWHASPGLSGGVWLGVRPARALAVGARVELDVPLIVQRYLLAGASVLEVTRPALGAQLAVELEL